MKHRTLKTEKNDSQKYNTYHETSPESSLVWDVALHC